MRPIILPDKAIWQENDSTVTILKIRWQFKKTQQIKITWLNSQELISSFCYSSSRSRVWLKAVFDEVMSFQSVSKSLVQTPSLLGAQYPPLPSLIKKKLNQVIRMRCFDSNNIHSRLCAELSCSNQVWWYQTQSQVTKERCSHLILKTNNDSHPPHPNIFGPTQCLQMLGPTLKCI